MEEKRSQNRYHCISDCLSSLSPCGPLKKKKKDKNQPSQRFILCTSWLHPFLFDFTRALSWFLCLCLKNADHTALPRAQQYLLQRLACEVSATKIMMLFCLFSDFPNQENLRNRLFIFYFLRVEAVQYLSIIVRATTIYKMILSLLVEFYHLSLSSCLDCRLHEE